jgi:photosystem II stability/assembly factor-like uncharacterized protein
MQELKCRLARELLVAPWDLAPLDARRLDRHLLTCPTCAEMQRFNREMDRLINVGLSTSVEGLSVREQTRHRLLERSGTQRNRGEAARNRRSLRWLAPRRSWLVAPAAAVIAVLALVLPQILSPAANSPVPVGAAWKVKGLKIAFAMTVDPIHAGHLLAGDAGRVYESWNGGSSWRPLDKLPGGVVRALVIDWSRPSHYLVALRHSVAVSDDAGRHWRLTARGLLGAQNMFLIQDPNRPETFYVGPGVIWRSDDGGTSWTQAGQNIFAPGGVQSLAPVGSGELITGIWQGGAAISRDGGRTWRHRSAGLAPGVFDVEAGDGRLWAATNRGIYSSSDLGLHWRPSFPYRHLLMTSVLPGAGYVLAGGKGGVFRSTDGGSTWEIISKGLPLAPYVYSFAVDPHHPGRVYATLNADGIFRSDDGGVTWAPASGGLRLSQGQAAPVVLFWHAATLWRTDGVGTDPGNLTSDPHIGTAVSSPDGASVAYIATSGDSWAARIIGAGGGLPKTVAQSGGAPPTAVYWSATSSSTALESDSTVFTSGSVSHQWPRSPGEQLLGWSRDGSSLLFWRSDSSQIVTRDPANGRLLSTLRNVYPTLPSVAPDGAHVALVSSGYLYTGTWDGLQQPATPVDSACVVGPWSSDSSRLLLTCPGRVEERSSQGQLMVAGALPSGAFWVPGSSTDLLFFRHGLQRWSPHAGARLLEPDATSVQSS